MYGVGAFVSTNIETDDPTAGNISRPFSSLQVMRTDHVLHLLFVALRQFRDLFLVLRSQLGVLRGHLAAVACCDQVHKPLLVRGIA